MSERTSPTDALETLAWHLNYHSGNNVSLNQVAEATGLAWATVRKYTQTLSMLQKIAPDVRVEPDGLTVGRRTGTMRDLFSQRTPALAVYLFTHARTKGNATTPLQVSVHQDVLEEFERELREMEDFGWIERDDDSIQLTSLGVNIAGMEYSQQMNAEPDIGKLQIHKSRGQTTAVIDEDAEGDSLVGAEASPQRQAFPSESEGNWYHSGLNRQSPPTSLLDDSTRRELEGHLKKALDAYESSQSSKNTPDNEFERVTNAAATT